MALLFLEPVPMCTPLGYYAGGTSPSCSCCRSDLPQGGPSSAPTSHRWGRTPTTRLKESWAKLWNGVKNYLVVPAIYPVSLLALSLRKRMESTIHYDRILIRKPYILYSLTKIMIIKYIEMCYILSKIC